MADNTLVKVVFEQDYEDSDELDVETPWALSLGDNRYQLKNYPFFAYGISFDDIFEALPRHDDDERPYLSRVLEKSGHKTLRIVLAESIKESAAAMAVLHQLSAMDCGYEGNGARFFVVNVQPHCDLAAVCAFLSSQALDWEHADPPAEAFESPTQH